MKPISSDMATSLDYVKKDLRMAMPITCCDKLDEATRDILLVDK